ncbi:unnamed protein product [Dracunculus medinensis]|uniref:But2 domain-containing protein n=1 Tax=Dracunculus medinensis TaxID=318479 RepID=A0A0N4UC81_DRAME|nr:unnamed protein product [Dracunculus medinensis]
MYLFALQSALISFLIATSDACKIQFRMTSKADSPFKVQFIVPSISYSSPELEFLTKDQSIIHDIQGEQCDAKKWHIIIWKQEDDDFIPVHDYQTKFEGIGHVSFEVDNTYTPDFTDRFGVFQSNL